MNKIILTLILIILITGCSIKPQRVVVTETKLVYTSIPSHYLTSCETTQPPNQKDYLAIEDTLDGYVEKETILSKYATSLILDIKKCNEKLQAIKKFDADQTKLINKKK